MISVHISIIYNLFWLFIIWRRFVYASIKLQWNLGDTAVQDRKSGSSIRLIQTLCDRRDLPFYSTKIAFWTDRSFVWHRVVGLKSWSNNLSLIALPRLNRLTSNFRSLLFFVSSHWAFNTEWSFIIKNDYEFFQNPYF